MNDHDADELVALLLDAYPQVELRERTVSIYKRWIHDLDRGVTEEIIEELIAHSPVLPSVAQDPSRRCRAGDGSTYSGRGLDLCQRAAEHP